PPLGGGIRSSSPLSSGERGKADSLRGGTDEKRRPSMVEHRKPTPEDLAAAYGRTVPDVLAPDLRILFCGINPSLYSAAVGHHFARPGNRFWPTLHAAGFTPRLLSPFADRQLLEHGYGIATLVARATATADELSADELSRGARRLQRSVRRYRPVWVAFLGISAYRIAFDRKGAVPGPQRQELGGSGIWLLP